MSPTASSSCRRGYLYHYAFAMLIGIAALVTWMMLGSSASDDGRGPSYLLVTFLPLVGVR
jgi:hypothetical protein